MSKLYSCVITSQRPTHFKFKYQEYMTSCKRLKKRLHDVFVELYRRGVRRFYVGGALGVDLWAGEILLEMGRQEEYQGLARGWRSCWSSRSRAMTSDGTQRAGSGFAI